MLLPIIGDKISWKNSYNATKIKINQRKTNESWGWKGNGNGGLFSGWLAGWWVGGVWLVGGMRLTTIGKKKIK